MPSQSAHVSRTFGRPVARLTAIATASRTPSALADHMWYEATRPYFVTSKVARET